MGFTNQTSSVDAGCSKLPAKGIGNRSRNSESRITKSPCHSPLSDSSEKSQKANPVSLQDVVGDVTPETATVKHDGMCCEVTTGGQMCPFVCVFELES